MHDIIIVGGGPAGLTAALYARRAGKRVLIIEKGGFGGQMTFSPKIENYPAFLSVSGSELADKMVEQVLDQGADVEVETVTGIERHSKGGHCGNRRTPSAPRRAGRGQIPRRRRVVLCGL